MLQQARQVLDSLTASVQLNQREPPADHDADQLKARVVTALEAL